MGSSNAVYQIKTKVAAKCIGDPVLDWSITNKLFTSENQQHKHLI